MEVARIPTEALNDALERRLTLRGNQTSIRQYRIPILHPPFAKSSELEYYP